MAENDDARLVHAWQSTPRTEIRGQLRTYRGKRRIDLRQWVTEGEIPTSRGLSLTLEELPKLRTMVDALERACREEATDGA